MLPMQKLTLSAARSYGRVHFRYASSFKYVISDERGAKKNVGFVQMNNPKTNSLSDQHFVDILGALREHNANPQIGCIVLTGVGKIFSAGADIEQLVKRDYSKVLKDDFLRAWDEIACFKKPIIAAVNGLALGGGCEIAMACDMIVASSHARFGQPEIKLGTLPGAGGTQRLVRLVGKSKAMEMVMSGDPINAEEALRCGLVARVFPADKFVAETIKLAESIARHSQAALATVKDCVNRSFEMTLREGILYERKMFYASFATNDRQEGMKAFLEKREPQWKHE